MIDFLKTNPYVTREDYLWKWTIPQIQLASNDFTHTVVLSKEEVEKRKRNKKAKTYDDPLKLITDLGLPTFNKK